MLTCPVLMRDTGAVLAIDPSQSDATSIGDLAIKDGRPRTREPGPHEATRGQGHHRLASTARNDGVHVHPTKTQEALLQLRESWIQVGVGFCHSSTQDGLHHGPFLVEVP